MVLVPLDLDLVSVIPGRVRRPPGNPTCNHLPTILVDVALALALNQGRHCHNLKQNVLKLAAVVLVLTLADSRPLVEITCTPTEIVRAPMTTTLAPASTTRARTPVSAARAPVDVAKLCARRPISVNLIPAPFKNGQIPSGNNPKAGDYEEHVKNIINTACHQFEILVATEDPYPPPATTVVWATRVWADISRSTSATYQLSSRIEKIITSRTSHARGALRDHIRLHIESSYGFDRESTLDRVKQQNMARYMHILDRDSPSPEPRFYYADMENRQGFAR
ncbi:hypothetical protein BC628DRAFT_1420023 [Trametes gibbosa]|nr:hypothetical protein BC628DRAFT_1420023 [Trametes gibbosa]